MEEYTTSDDDGNPVEEDDFLYFYGNIPKGWNENEKAKTRKRFLKNMDDKPKYSVNDNFWLDYN